ncbi:MAG: type II secretion system protein [Planctomycetota bacterium]|nr:type II secretion system protein [Planctomycetota bacterium]
MTSYTRTNSPGFTLVELMVALGLTVVILVAMAQVFQISSEVVGQSIRQANFYSRLATAHSFMSEDFLFHDPFEEPASNIAGQWTVADVNSEGAGDMVPDRVPDWRRRSPFAGGRLAARREAGYIAPRRFVLHANSQGLPARHRAFLRVRKGRCDVLRPLEHSGNTYVPFLCE